MDSNVISKLSDIVDNNYRFEFKYSIKEPICEPVFDDYIKIWITEDGVVIKGHKTYGKVGKSIFKFMCSGTFLLCKWEDVREYQTRNRNCIKITVHPNIVYRYDIGERVVRNHVRLAEKYRDEIMSSEGKGATKEVLNHLLNDGCWYIDGLDVFFLKKYTSGRYWYKNVMRADEFRKVKI